MKRAERHQLGVIIEEVRAWVDTAQEVRQLAAHMPAWGPGVLSPDDDALLIALERVAAEGSPDEAGRLAKTAWLDGRKKLQPAHQAADHVTIFHRNFKASAGNERLAALRAGLAVRANTERGELGRILADVDRSRSLARQMLHDARHLPMTHSGTVSSEETAVAQSMIQVVNAHHEDAVILLDTSACRTNACTKAHSSAYALIQAHAEARQAGLFHPIEQAASRVSRQLSSELARLPGILANLDYWRAAARQVLTDIEHLPLTRTGVLAEHEAQVIRELIDAYDANIQAARAFHPSLCATGGCAAVHQPVAALCTYQAKAVASGDGKLIVGAAERVARQMLAEREQLAVALHDLDAWRSASVQALYAAEHMPLTRFGVLSHRERTAMGTIVKLVASHGAQAGALVDPTGCLTGACRDRHRSGALLGRSHADGLRSGIGAEVADAAGRVSAQLLHEQQAVARLHERVTTWPDRVEAVRRARADAAGLAGSRAAQLIADSTAVTINQTPMCLLPLQNQDDMLAACLALLRDKPLPLSAKLS